MTALLRAIDAELLKMKRTLALTLIFVTPLAVCALNLLILLRRLSLMPDEPLEVWYYLIQNNVGLWGLLMLPLFITLETALMAALDHNANGWKHLYALPLPRWAIYLAKQFVALALIGGSMLVIGVGTLLAGLFVQMVAAPGQLTPAILPWGTLVSSLGLLFLSSWLIIAIHTWVSLHWASFTVASTVGIVATVTSFIVINSVELSGFFPWSIPLRAAGPLVMDIPDAPLALPLGLVGGVVVALLACWDVTRRDVL
jgi:hypothetical protein